MDVSGTGVDAPELSARLEQRGTLIGAMGATMLRAVTHLDVTRDKVDEAAAQLRQVVIESKS